MPKYDESKGRGSHPLYSELETMADELGIAIEWKFYKDGGWLGKGATKSKTIFWTGMQPCFEVAFHFSQKHFAGLGNLKLSDATKQMISEQDTTKKFISLLFKIEDKLPGDLVTIMQYKKGCK